MDIEIARPVLSPPIPRAYAVTMIIKTFKGRKDVEVHLFRPEWDVEEEEGYDWDYLLGEPIDPLAGGDVGGSRKVLLESFTEAERDKVVEYLRCRYADKLLAIRSCALEFPVPKGLTALTDIPEGKLVGFIRFERIQSYNLPFPLRGFYDLSQHKPIIEVET